MGGNVKSRMAGFFALVLSAVLLLDGFCVTAMAATTGKVYVINGSSEENKGKIPGDNEAWGWWEATSGISLTDLRYDTPIGEQANLQIDGKIISHWELWHNLCGHFGDKACVAQGDKDGKISAVQYTTANEYGEYSNKEPILYILYEDIIYPVTVTGGTSDKTTAVMGETVKVTATVPSGKQFKEWKATGGITLAKTATATFTMPASAVEITAVFEDEPAKPAETGTQITVSGGKATGKSTFKVTGGGTEPAVAFTKADKKATTVTIPSVIKDKNGVSYKVTEISASAFSKCSSLKKVTIGENIEKIGKKAFSGCKNLKTVSIKSKNIKSIGKNAFKGIHKNAKISVPKKQKKAYTALLKKAKYTGKIK